MDSSTVSFAIACAAAAVASAPAFAQQDTAPRACSLAAASTTLDAQGGTGVFRGVRLSCDGITIAADEATATEVVPQSGQWQLRDNIRITMDSAVFTADRATFGFAQNALVSGELIGGPAVLEDLIPEEDKAVRATATRIYYDNVNRTARMEGGASLTLGTSEMSGCGDIIYDLERGLVDSVSTCDEPFVIRFVPRADNPAPAENAPAP